jgi:hypothetical protein
MRTRGGVLAVVSGVVLMLAGVTGCSDPPASPLASDGPTKTARAPVFDSLDEAFEAAVATYQRYVDLWNQIAAEGGANPERLLEVMEDNELAAEEMATFGDFAANGERVQGATSFAKPRLMQYQDAASLIQMYACSDISGARLIDRDGNDITPEREELIPVMITFHLTASAEVLVSEREVWARPGIC